MVVQGYITDLIDGTSIRFLYFEPITENLDAQYDEPPVRGRSEPHLFYSQTGADHYSFNITFAASVDALDGGSTEMIYTQYLFLKSFQYPDYGLNNVGPVQPPHKVAITIGRFFRKKGVIIQPSFNFHPPYDTNGYPHRIECQFTFRVINDTPLSLSDVRRNLGNTAR